MAPGGGSSTGRRVVTQRMLETEIARGREPVGKKPDDSLTAVVKYVPAEIVATYITVETAIKSAPAPPSWLLWLVFVALLVITFFYTLRATTEKKPGLSGEDKPAAWGQCFISTGAFFVWVLALGGPFITVSGYQAIYGAVLLPVYTLLIPLFTTRAS